MCRLKDNQNLALPDLIRIDHIISQNIQLREQVRQLEIHEVANNLVRTADRIQLEREIMELRAELRERKMVPNLVVNYYKATYNMNTPKMKNNELVSSTRFEDLSNELIYEIFNYLDSWEIYKTFVQLNIRFQYLFRSDIFRLKINLPLLAKRNVFLRCEKLRNQRKKCRNQLIACLDDLSNEIFYEIFDYLNGCEIDDKYI
ncbi:unnamed protein product [Rotaria magnacalcarata]